MTKKIEWMKNSSLTQLHTGVKQNFDRYRAGDFSDLVDSGWRQKTVLDFEDDAFDGLSGASGDDLEDSLIVFDALKALPPNLASCMNIWVPLIHTELLEYTRKRWLEAGGTDKELQSSIDIHVFKGGIGGYRDDNSIGRLWWSGYIGSRIAESNDKNEIRKVLGPLMRSTDTRQSVIERPGVFTEVKLARSISTYVEQNKLPNSDKDAVFREFMVSINLKSNGRNFGDMTEPEIHCFLDSCR